MITVAGFNTAIDRRIRVEALLPGTVQRATAVEALPGGKGLHVAQTVAALGESVELVGLVDAAHRERLEQHMHERGVGFHGVAFQGPLRNCIAVHDRDGAVTEILDPGPPTTPAEREALLHGVRERLARSRLLVLSGSLPRGFDAGTYADLARQAADARVPCLVDTSGEALRRAADAAPYLLKPNRDEAAELAGRALATVADAAAVAHALHARGVARPVLTLGADGAVGFDGSETWHAHVPPTRSVNAVGSGDCLLAGLAVALLRGAPLQEALRLGVACGAANAMDEETGFVRSGQVEAVLGQVRMRRVPA